MKFEKQNLEEMNNKGSKKTRKRRIFWFNPPYDMNVSTKVGRKFFKILDETIPPGHPLHKTFNRHTVKLSYSTMPNMLKKISVHNSRVTAKAQAEAGQVTSAPDDDIYKQEEEHCNCNGRMGPCPLDGNCRIESD